jgi:hypothetical protein
MVIWENRTFSSARAFCGSKAKRTGKAAVEKSWSGKQSSSENDYKS